MRGISKAYGHVQALDNIDFEVFPAEVVALVGTMAPASPR